MLASLRPADDERVELAVGAQRLPPHAGPISGSGLVTVKDLLRALWQRRLPLEAPVREKGAELWEAYAGDDPRRLFVLLRKELPPPLCADRAAYAARFPRRIAGRLRLSRLDTVLLEAARDEADVPSVIQAVERAGLDGALPKAYVQDRLLDHVEHQPPTLALAADTSLPPFVQPSTHRYRLTPHGLRLLDRGADGPEELPPLDIGGYRADATAPVWVVCEDGAEPRLEEWAPGPAEEPAWNRPLQSFIAAPSLGRIKIYHDFDWERVSGHRRRSFPGAGSLAAEAQWSCPPGKSPALLLSDQPLPMSTFQKTLQTAREAVFVRQPLAVFDRHRPALENTAHLVLGGSAGGSLIMLGITPQTILAERDPCTIGPCRADPQAHLETRNRFWAEQDPRWADRPGQRLLAEPPAGRLCLWAGTAWAEQLFLWRMCDELARASVDPARIDVPFLDEERAGSRMTIGSCNPSTLWRLWLRRTPLSAALLARGAALWRAYVADTPAPLVALCADEHPDPLRPRLTELAALLPRRTARGLALSRLDHSLLVPFRAGPGPWFLGLQIDADRWYPMMDMFGDLMLEARSAAWTRAAPPALERHYEGEHRGAHRYRLTPHGERLLAEGFRDPSELLPLPFGGYANDGRAPVWVCVEGEGLRLEPWP